MSRHYVLDFDGTLFDTEVMWQRWVDQLVTAGVAFEHAAQTAEELFHNGFTLQGHALAVGLEGEAQQQLIEAFEGWIREHGPQLLYPDVFSFLQDRPSTVLTHGEEAFQKFKITSAGLDSRIGGILIAGPEYRKVKHLEEMLAMREVPHFFFDDNPKELIRVHEAGLPVELVRMRREGQRHAKDDHELDDQVWRVIRSLNELE